jgi:cytochrome c553
MYISEIHLPRTSCNRTGAIGGKLLLAVLATSAIVVGLPLGYVGNRPRAQTRQNEYENLATNTPAADRETQAGERRLFPVHIRPGPATPTIDLSVVQPDGSNVTASCSTCHANRPADTTNRLSQDLTEFHQTLSVQHGTTSCLSCHNQDNYDQLRLADGRAVEFPDVMQLCAQCHGPQMTDYLHGAHGGMAGYWDLTKGPQTRNNCVDCHHPHQPAFPSMQPTFKPIDRFLTDEVKRHDHD